MVPNFRTRNSTLSVVIPVGPLKHHQKWLHLALESIVHQTLYPIEIILIDDMANLRNIPGVTIYKTPWNLGPTACWNIGVAIAKTNCVFIMSSDDTLEPECLSQCMRKYKIERADGFYYPTLRYLYEPGVTPKYGCPPNGSVVVQSAGVGLVTKHLWRITGGLPHNLPIGADIAFKDILHKYGIASCYSVGGGDSALYNFRVHKEQNSNMWEGWGVTAPNLISRSVDVWKRPNWGRFEP